jgi:hypothetical protein
MRPPWKLQPRPAPPVTIGLTRVRCPDGAVASYTVAGYAEAGRDEQVSLVLTGDGNTSDPPAK